jgi:hypothetical protein
LDSKRARLGLIGIVAAVVIAAIAWTRAKDAERGSVGSSDAGTSEAAATDGGAKPFAVPHARETVKALDGALRACFDAQQSRAPQPRGRALFELAIDAAGEVTAVTVRSRESYDDPTIACMSDVFKSAKFEESLDGRPSTLNTPVNLLAYRGDAGSGRHWAPIGVTDGIPMTGRSRDASTPDQ